MPRCQSAMLPAHLTLQKEVANWIIGDLSRLLNENRREISDSPVTPHRFIRPARPDLRRHAVHIPRQNGVGRNVRHRQNRRSGRRRERPRPNQRHRRHRGPPSTEAIAANPKAVADYLDGKGKRRPFPHGPGHAQSPRARLNRTSPSAWCRKASKLRKADVVQSIATESHMTLLNVAQIIASVILVLIILSQVREAGQRNVR